MLQYKSLLEIALYMTNEQILLYMSDEAIILLYMSNGQILKYMSDDRQEIITRTCSCPNQIRRQIESQFSRL